MPPRLASDLPDAFRSSTYWAALPLAYVGLRIDQCHPILDSVLEEMNVSSWVVITACNPRSQLLTPTENSRRMHELVEVVEAAGWPTLSACGVGHSSDWPPEPSLMVFGIGEHEALELARRFDQLAFVFGERSLPARLCSTQI